jgi:hypothetical protein
LPSAFLLFTQGPKTSERFLDLSIRQETPMGKYSLDDVMRALFSDQYKKGRGFTTEDMNGNVNRLTKKDYPRISTGDMFSERMLL